MASLKKLARRSSAFAAEHDRIMLAFARGEDLVRGECGRVEAFRFVLSPWHQVALRPLPVMVERAPFRASLITMARVAAFPVTHGGPA